MSEPPPSPGPVEHRGRQWLLMFRPETYELVKQHQVIGVITGHRERFSRVRPGDRVVVYVSQRQELDAYGQITSNPSSRPSQSSGRSLRDTPSARASSSRGLGSRGSPSSCYTGFQPWSPRPPLQRIGSSVAVGSSGSPRRTTTGWWAAWRGASNRSGRTRRAEWIRSAGAWCSAERPAD